jgi:predicted MFS family arabinose efflux permease
LVPLRLFRSRAVTGANLMMVLIGTAMFGVFFFLSQYLQDVQGYSPLSTGFAFLPMPLFLIAGAQISSRLLGRVGGRVLLTIAPLVGAIGVFGLSRIHTGTPYWQIGLPGSILTFGVGLALVPITMAATTGVAPRDAGLASGLINTTRQIGGSLGLSVLLTIATARAHSTLSHGAAYAETAGYARAFLATAVLLLVAAAIAATVLPRIGRPVAPVGASTTKPVEAVAVEAG